MSLERRVAYGVYLFGIALLAAAYVAMRGRLASEILLGAGALYLLKLRFLSQWLARHITRRLTG